MSQQRVQKIIAASGLCSRRDAEELIREGRVVVNGKVIILGDKAEAETDHIKVDGKAIRRPEPHRYILLNKPREVMTTCEDPEERTTVIDLVESAVKERIYPVGRLDYHSEGLLILTNDGDLAAVVAHPRHGLVREYTVKIRGDLSEDERRRLMRGATLGGRRVRPRMAKREKRIKGSANTWWRIEVTEGRTHEVRELFFRAGHHVQRLRRTAIGPIRDASLKPGEFRLLTDDEVAKLKAFGEERPRGKKGRR